MSADELFKSRFSQQGVNGNSAVRMFLVTSTDQNVDPLTDTGLPVQGDPYPFNPALFCQDRGVIDRLTHTKSVIEVRYGDPNIVPPITAGPWSITVAGGIGSETLYVSPILSTYGANQKPMVIGPHVYLDNPPLPPDPALTAFTSTRNSGGNIGDVTLYRNTAKVGRKRVGVERRVPVGSLVATARFYIVSMPALASLQTYSTYTNALEWYGYPAGTLMFAYPTIDYRPDPAGIQPRGYATDVTLFFEFNANGWSHNVTDIFESDDGYSDIVKQGGNVVSTDYIIYEKINFDTLLGLIQ